MRRLVPGWRRLTWATLGSILVFTAIMAAWAIWEGSRSAGCGTPAMKSYPYDCKSSEALARALYVWLILVLWAFGLIVLAAAWLVTWFATRTACPRCGKKASPSRNTCRSCRYDLLPRDTSVPAV